MTITVLAFGDVVGRPGREAVTRYLPGLKRRLSPDFVIVNAENASGGLGIDEKTAREIRAAGVDVITLGDHAWHRKEARRLLENEQGWMIRPGNYPSGAPGKGGVKTTLPSGITVGVANVLGRVFIDSPLDCPFRAARKIVEEDLAGCQVKIMDIHAEATSEKEAIARYLDGYVSLVFGTHTHVPTADERILPKGTAFISDLGMCGSLDGVIGMDPEVAIGRFLTGLPRSYEVSQGPGTLQGIVCRIDETTAKAISIERIREQG